MLASKLSERSTSIIIRLPANCQYNEHHNSELGKPRSLIKEPVSKITINQNQFFSLYNIEFKSLISSKLQALNLICSSLSVKLIDSEVNFGVLVQTSHGDSIEEGILRIRYIQEF
jgi:hypothetical protein